MRFTPFREVYRSLLGEAFRNGYLETNSRTGAQIKVIAGGTSFKLDLSGNMQLPVAGNRRYWPRVAAAEVAWQFMGTQDPDWIISKAPRLWKDFVEKGKLKTAYGYRWQKHFGRNQLDQALHELQNNPTNRQLYISAWDPATDGLGSPNQPKNIPCPVGFSLTRTSNVIHMSVFLRSSDLFIGLPYDVMSYSLTLDAIAAHCGCIPGYIHFTLAHAHYYDIHNDIICKSLTSDEHRIWPTKVQPQLPAWTVKAIKENPDGYVDHVARLASRVNNNDWDPKPELVL